jgi:hypothetical protein
METLILKSKDPGPEGPALVHPRGVICVITFTTVFRCQVSGVGCQRGAKLIIGYLF